LTNGEARKENGKSKNYIGIGEKDALGEKKGI